MPQTQEIPSVLAVLVTRNGIPWLRRALSSLARQTHPRFGVVGVDNASSDGSADLLERVLGPRRVLRMEEDRGFSGAVARALELSAAAQADFVLLLHDDVALKPDAVERMVEAAGQVPGVGAVGPKVVDWDGAGVLREVGFSADRFGYPQSPLEEGELDQGQYDAPREVLFISSTAMLASREAWSRVGLPDDRLTPADGDLDYCWRMRLAGFRVMVTPGAVAHHRAAGASGARAEAPPARIRYRTERAALAAVLANNRLLTLLWVLPLYAIQGLGRLALYLLSRRFDRAADVLGAWGWNLVHLPSTFRRHVRAQAMRKVPDREISRFMSPATGRLTRWVQQASTLMLGRRVGRVEEGDELEAPPLPRRVASVVAAHPVAVASIAATVFTLVAFRGVLFVPHIEGGALPVFPDQAGDFFGALAAPWRATAFGGAEAPSPALVPLGVGSFLTFGSPELLARLLVALTPVVAGYSCHVALRRLGVAPGPAVVGATTYALSALVLWAASEGRIPVAVLLVALPWLTARLVAAFAPGGPSRPLPWMVGTGMALAVAVSFFPSIRLALALLVASLLILPDRGGSRVRGTLLAAAAAAVSAALVFPLVLLLSESGGGGAVEASAPARILSLLRLSAGDAPGSGPAAFFLPVAGLIGFVVAEGSRRRTAWRSLLVAAAGIPLAWLAAAGHLPGPLAGSLAYLCAAAMSLAFLVALGAEGLGPALRRAAFGLPQVLGALLVGVVAVGAVGQAVDTLPGSWGVGAERLPPAWPVVTSSEPGTTLRLLWLGKDDGRPFPAPGGDPQGSVTTERGVAVAYGVTGRRGRSVMATGLPASGLPFERLEEVLAGVLSGRIRHGGALLAPFGVRMVIAGGGRLPAPVASALAGQVDLDLIQRAGGLSIYRNARPIPKAAGLAGPEALEAGRATSILAPLALDPTGATPLEREDTAQWSGSVPDAGLVLVSDRFDPRWRSADRAPFPAFGWALGFPAEGGPVDVAIESDARRPIELGTLAVLWLIALWFVRRSGGRAEQLEARVVASDAEASPVQPAKSRSPG
jgi:GT2 family glycosyltransferase